MLIRLNPGPTDPKKRAVSEFILGDLDVWLSQDENKVRVIRALLILITSWVNHGAPRSTVQHRFASWAATVGGVLEYHEVNDFLANQAAVEEHVYHDEHLADFFRCWHELHGDKPQGVKKLRDGWARTPSARTTSSGRATGRGARRANCCPGGGWAASCAMPSARTTAATRSMRSQTGTAVSFSRSPSSSSRKRVTSLQLHRVTRNPDYRELKLTTTPLEPRDPVKIGRVVAGHGITGLRGIKRPNFPGGSERIMATDSHAPPGRSRPAERGPLQTP